MRKIQWVTGCCLLALALALAAGGCLLVPSSPARLWFFTYASESDSAGPGGLSPTSFLYLRANGTYTRDFGRFDTGTWRIDRNRLVLLSGMGSQELFPVRYLGRDRMKLETSSGALLDFESRPNRTAEPREDPFLAENNQWRLPPLAHEDDAALRARLRNHCRFFEAYFRWALDNGISSIDVRSTPSPIKIYGNGFAVKQFQDLPAAWKGYFYSETDCQRAQALLRDLFLHQTIAWPQTDNKYKLFISAFQQLQALLR
ncbi:MAG TPA: hypothetical protein VG870_11370 [Chitinophagaceae bacterium]|nr:hypothetical protein [Chitinophagaceae bacterium]